MRYTDLKKLQSHWDKNRKLSWPPKNKQEFKKLVLRLIPGVLLIALVVLVLIPIVTYIYFIRDLATKETIMNRNDTGVVLLDRNGTPFFSFYEAKQRTFIPLSDIPRDVQTAIVSIEDKDFYHHNGFSFTAIAAALWADIQRNELRYGGSTITQQLVKNALLTSDKSFLRKYQEVVLAMEIERRYSKDEILEMYLNSVYFGEGSYGIQNAAQRYFDKDAKNLNLAESAMLAGLPVAPSNLSPISGDREQAEFRQQQVLEKMVQRGYIDDAARNQAIDTELSYQEADDERPAQAAHFALMVRDRLVEQFGEEQISRSGFKVYTTLDLNWQTYAEEQVFTQVRRLATSQVSNGAAVVLDPKNGEIKAYVGSYDWTDEKFGKVNIPTTPRQPGSAFKPIVYAAGLEKRIITAASVLEDEKTSYPQFDGNSYTPVNYDGTFRGDVLVRRALANSLNVPAVEVMQKVGVPTALDTAKRLGITTLGDADQYGLSLVLGSGEVSLLELTGVYGVFANGGTKVAPIMISKIDDKNGRRVFNSQTQTNSVLSKEVSFLISSILSDNQARQEEFGNALTISRNAAVKTGTTNDYKDSWTVGYTPSLVVGVWVGNNDNTPMNRVAGSLGAAPIWRNLMEKFLRNSPQENFEPPSQINQVFVCRSSGLLYRETTATSSAYREYFLKGSEPTRPCFIPTPTPTPSALPSEIPSGVPTPPVTITGPGNGNGNGNGNNGNPPGQDNDDGDEDDD